MSVENQPKQLSRWPGRLEISLEVLKIIAGGSIVLTSMAAPNLVQMLPLLSFDPRRRDRPYYVCDISRAVKTLKKGRYITCFRTKNGNALQLTERGQQALARFELGKFTLKTNEKWDGKWRLVIFDIREWHRHVRDQLRDLLIQHNFFRLQDSVWVHPFPCEEFVELVKTGYGVRHEVYYLVVSSMAYDEKLRTFFTVTFVRSFDRTAEPNES